MRDHAPKQETPSSLPAPPQMPLPEIPQPWLVSWPASCQFEGRPVRGEATGSGGEEAPCRFGGRPSRSGGKEVAPECVGAAGSRREAAGSLPGGWCVFDNQCGYTAVEIRRLGGKISTGART